MIELAGIVQVVTRLSLLLLLLLCLPGIYAAKSVDHIVILGEPMSYKGFVAYDHEASGESLLARYEGKDETYGPKS